MNHGHVVTIELGCMPQHQSFELIPNTPQGFTPTFMATDYGPKMACFAVDSFLESQLIMDIFIKNHELGIGLASHLVPYMLRVNKHTESYLLTERFGYIWWLA